MCLGYKDMISSHFCHRHQRLLVHVEDVGKAGEEPGEEPGERQEGTKIDFNIFVLLTLLFKNQIIL